MKRIQQTINVNQNDMSKISTWSSKLPASLSACLFVLCLLMFGSNASAQTEPDRMADDFVLTSLCIADPTDWREDVLGTTGHAFLRLQCPFYGLDYCFSYEGENINDNLLRYVSGETKMGMFAIPTAEYLKDYEHWNRSVHEYRLNLPADAEVRLWEIMDNHLTQGIVLRQDLNKYGCAITVVRYVKKALGKTRIVYAKDEALSSMTRREIGYRSLHRYPWLRLSSMLMTDNRYDKQCPLDEKLVVPADLAEVWQHAKVADKPMATYIGDLVEGAALPDKDPWFTPMLLSVLILLITLAFVLTRYAYWDWLMLSVQAVFGIMLIATWVMMKEFGSSALLLLVLFNPLPLICIRWRRVWSMPYAIVLLVWAVVLALWPHMLVDPSLIVLCLSFVVIYSKDWVRKKLNTRKR